MVKLNLESSHDKNETPSLYKWDVEYRKNHAAYQHEIDKLTYNLQRARRGFTIFGSWLYPLGQQSNFLNLELLKKKQMVGKIFPNEIEEYSRFNRDLSDDLERTFKANYPFPIFGFGSGLALNVVAHAFNFPYSYRIGFLVLPMFIDIVANLSTGKNKTNSLEFLNWVLVYRTAACRLESDSKEFNPRKFKLYKNLMEDNKTKRPLTDLQTQIRDLVVKEAPMEFNFDTN